jgi:hypothetical protein
MNLGLGKEVRLHAPLLGSELGAFLSTYGSNCEIYSRIEYDSFSDGPPRVVLYVVKRDSDRPGVGKLFASRAIPLLPEED